MKYKTFQEYLDDKGNIPKNVRTKHVADYEGPFAKSPGKQNMKHQHGVEADDPSPYRAPGTDPGLRVADDSDKEKGFGDHGEPRLKYEPDTDTEHDERVVASWPNAKVTTAPIAGSDDPHAKHKTKHKTKTESFLDMTRSMTPQQFANFMIKESGCGCEMQDNDIPMVTAYTKGKYHPHPPEAVKYVVVLANKNESIMDNFIHEMKRAGGLKSLLSSLMGHPETYDSLTDLLGEDEKGPSRCKALARAMDGSYARFLQDQDDLYESVGPPIGMDDEDEDNENDLDPSEIDPGDEMEPEDDEMGMEPEDNEMGMEPEDDEMGGMGGEMDDEGDVNLDDLDLDMDDMGNEKQDKPKKLRKRFAHDNMIAAMKGYKHMLHKMSSY